MRKPGGVGREKGTARLYLHRAVVSAMVGWQQGLLRVLEDHPLERKYLLVPSRRVGLQVLESIARRGTGTVNVHLSDLRGFVVGTLADGFVDLSGREYADRLQLELVILHCLERLSETGKDHYFTRLKPGPGLLSSLAGALRDIRMAALVDEEVVEKLSHLGPRGEGLANLLYLYENVLDRLGLVDYPGVLSACLTRASRSPGELGSFLGDAIIVAPATVMERWTTAERRFWELLPERHKVVLEDGWGSEGEGHISAALPPFSQGGEASRRKPGPYKLEIRGAVGLTNEVRWVFRKILEDGIPLDQVEVLYTDDSTYRPLLLDLSHALLAQPARPRRDVAGVEEGEGTFPTKMREDLETKRDAAGSQEGEGTETGGDSRTSPGEVGEAGPVQEAPISLSRGIPVRLTRPGRALLGWLEWLDSGGDPRVLARMVGERLFRLEGLDHETASALLLCLPLESHLPRELPSYLQGLAESLEGGYGAGPLPRFLEYWKNKLGRERLTFSLRELAILARDLLPHPDSGEGNGSSGNGGRNPTPHSDEDAKVLLSGALRLLRERVRLTGKVDSYAANLLEERLEQALNLAKRAGIKGPARGLLEGLIDEASVLGEGPRPGRLFACPLEEGGFSGRPYLFVLGLDSSRFPKAPAADPVLPVEDRTRLESLPIPSPGEDLRRLYEIMGQERKGVFLVFSRFDLQRDEETYPSPLLLPLSSWSREGIASPLGNGTLEELLRGLPPDITFAPETPASAATEGQWWAAAGIFWGSEVTRQASHRFFPHLGKGYHAQLQRREESFTEYDGHVPEAGTFLNPFDLQRGIVLSAKKLSRMGSNPFDFFLEEALGLETPPYHEPGIHPWLDPLVEGSLLHRLFQALTEALSPPDEKPPPLEKARELAETLLDKEFYLLEKMIPPVGRGVKERKRGEYLHIVQVFLENLYHLLESDIRIFPETAYGISGLPPGRTAQEEPVVVALAEGRQIRLRGVVDAVELDTKSWRCRVCDYKTGSRSRYDWKDPFRKGRDLQPIVYSLLVEEGGLPGLENRVQVSEFRYLLVGPGGLGEAHRWDRGDLEAGKSLLLELVGMIEQGMFPVSPEPEDLEFSPYLEVHEEPWAARKKTQKLKEHDETLAPLRRLRGGQGGA